MIYSNGKAVTFDGQSLNVINGFPGKLMLPYYPHVQYRNPSVGSTSWTTLTLNAPKRTFIYCTGQFNVMVMNGGQSDLSPVVNGGEGNTGAQLYSDEVVYANMARAVGYQKIATVTIVPATTFYNIPPADQNRLDFNTLVKADASHAFDLVMDLASDSQLSDPSGPMYLDGLHWSVAGCNYVASLFAANPTFNSWLSN
jgi:hypothetical protein